MRIRKSIGRIGIAFFILLLILFGRPGIFLLYSYYKDPEPSTATSSTYVNDASMLNNTRMDSIVNIPGDSIAAFTMIARLIEKASSENKFISVGGARHSMGGQTLYKLGILLNMTGLRYMYLDSSGQYITVAAGALWVDVIPFLDKHGKSVAVMQSNNSFSVGGSISVNCHGWQPNSPPIASTVESLRLIGMDGKMIRCSRSENAELFSLVLGGYGLFGVVIDVTLKTVDNAMYTTLQSVIKSEDYITEFSKLSGDTNVGFIYGRININPNDFMQEAILSVYKKDNEITLQPVEENGLKNFRRTVFRASANSRYGKNLRWRIEKLATRFVNGKHFSRNQLLNESVDIFKNTDTGYTDILHEYFIPKDSVTAFIHFLRSRLPAYQTDLLNITIRNVVKDNDSYLSYAKEEVFGFVMLFNQVKNKEAEIEMQKLTRVLIDKAISLRGTYYLPYRLHAMKHQFYHAYPNAQNFFRLKKKYDVNELFRNQFYEQYR